MSDGCQEANKSIPLHEPLLANHGSICVVVYIFPHVISDVISFDPRQGALRQKIEPSFTEEESGAPERRWHQKSQRKKSEEREAKQKDKACARKKREGHQPGQTPHGEREGPEGRVDHQRQVESQGENPPAEDRVFLPKSL